MGSLGNLFGTWLKSLAKLYNRQAYTKLEYKQQILGSLLQTCKRLVSEFYWLNYFCTLAHILMSLLRTGTFSNHRFGQHFKGKSVEPVIWQNSFRPAGVSLNNRCR